ncbi:hypothetical protein [Ruminococcus difficilis]|uniref:Uncharacterized protein n=1 Tax=Ruminococcus difficilis TaxID=2763069 RepID=A0A934TZ07_9FIRM|nr:hypothetical protein [Ruminococcus difficilis]MBK6088031.1 hypothetical protein [Ruminococcus difficilis]
MSKKPKNIDEPFSPEQLERLENKGDKQVQLQRQKEGMFQRYGAKRDSQDIAKQVRWKRRAGIALITLVAVLFLIWIMTWLLTTIGDLVITVDSGAAKKGISISEHENGDGSTYKLSANMVNEVTNITYDWLPATLDLEAEGSHNGRNYLAYTFYLTNNGQETLNYQSMLQSVKAAKDADEACRVMIYKNGEPEVFAKENRGLTSPDGSPEEFEKIFKKEIPENYTPPTAEEIEAAAEQPQNKELVNHTDEEIVIQPFVDSKTVFNTEVEGLEPGQTDKYTIVMWIEGEDPECLDVIRDGYVKLMWFFNIADEEL